MALPDWVAYAGIGVGVLTPLIAALKIRPEARKMDRDGGAAILTAGASLVKETRDELAELRKEVREFRTWREGLERRLRQHSRWDDERVAEARAHGWDVSDPPPLYDEREQVT